MLDAQPYQLHVFAHTLCQSIVDNYATYVTIMGRQGQRHTRNQTKPSGNDIYGLMSLNYIGKRNRTNTDSLSEYTVNTPYRTMTYTGPDQWLNNHDRLGLTTGWVKSLRYTKNTRSCIMSSTGYYRLLYNQNRLLLTNFYELLPGWVKSLRILKYTVVYYVIYRLRPAAL